MTSPAAGHAVPVIATGRPGWPALAVVAGLGAVVAAALWAYTGQVATGLGVTGLNTPAYWGLYVVNFVFFIGLSAGGVIVASLVHAFGLHHFRSVARIAELMAIACLVLAMSFILLDLGRPDRMLFLLRHGRPQSPLIWDVAVVNAYLVLSLTYGYFGTRADLVRAAHAYPGRRRLYETLALGYLDLSPRALARDERILRALAVVGLVGAIALHTVTAWILGLVKARPGWYGAIMAPLFIVSATVSGLALLLASVVFCRRAVGLPIGLPVVRRLAQLLTLALPVLGYFLFAELLTVVYAREPAALRVFEEMMFGRYALVFWGNLVLGLCLPIALLAWALLPLPPRGRTGELRIGVAAVLVVLGVLAERWNIVIPPLVGFAHLPYPRGAYVPTGTEVMLVLGVYAIGGLLFAVCARLLPLVEPEGEP